MNGFDHPTIVASTSNGKGKREEPPAPAEKVQRSTLQKPVKPGKLRKDGFGPSRLEVALPAIIAFDRYTKDRE